MRRALAALRGQVAGTASYSALAMAVSAGTGILTARALGPDYRGTLALALSIAGICVLTGALGTNVAVRRHLPRNDRVNRKGYLKITLVLILPLLCVLVIVLALILVRIDQSFFSIGLGSAFLGYGIALYFSNQALDLLNALGLVRVSAMVNASGSFVCLILVALCTYAGFDLQFFVW